MKSTIHDREIDPSRLRRAISEYDRHAAVEVEGLEWALGQPNSGRLVASFQRDLADIQARRYSAVRRLRKLESGAAWTLPQVADEAAPKRARAA